MVLLGLSSHLGGRSVDLENTYRCLLLVRAFALRPLSKTLPNIELNYTGLRALFHGGKVDKSLPTRSAALAR